MKTLAVLAALAVLLTGCSKSTDGAPEGAPRTEASGPAAKTDDVTIKTRKQVPDQLDCQTIITAAFVSQAIGTAVQPSTNAAVPGHCDYDVPKPDSSGKGLIQIFIKSVGYGENDELDGNTLLKEARTNQCNMDLAVAPKKFLGVSAVLNDGGGKDVCERTKTLVKAVFDTFPPAS